MDTLQDGTAGGLIGGLVAGVLLVAVPMAMAWWFRRSQRLRNAPAELALRAAEPVPDLLPRVARPEVTQRRDQPVA